MAKGTVRMLVVDDERIVCQSLKETLERIGHVVTTAYSGEEALEVLRENRFDAAVVDLNLGSQVDGLRVLEAIRWRWPETAVVILTGYGSLESAIAAIHEDVDDYLLKPVGAAEVRQAVLRALDAREKKRSQDSAETARVVRCGDFCVDLDQHLVTRNGQRIDLSPQEVTLLVHLMQNTHKVVSPVEMVQTVRGYQPESLQEAREIIKWYVHRLRKRIEPDTDNPRYIVNVRGVGYRFRG